ncbi:MULTISPECIES: alpha/beta fold hydrolase [Pseudoalteromonas]|uniref:Alpha/beta fold hydrolase n=2 Tax=Pseudoalteromonas TaxID=53246 RepID=A0AB39AVZ3_9GAMM|nr:MULTISPECIES: alpha/beta fold hydrolase [Pseudoalteromonas]KYL37286.1 esterase [Pseudoalteromonas spiralis]MDN3410359.1 alpha/beta fold hydrolase [Pseudoalteromonas sp. APC 3894]MDN3417552.1 alpha/beta fold hydrolase [Pseudoalteromonas sp. APC 3227]MDN3421153.1 alpha/beta fold hydrolase [Pseudoalteromonas sp. APC 3895]MDN3425050.1 alpha/beta fold hydrolase [Pseudoalteromonas sp. APC 3896]
MAVTQESVFIKLDDHQTLHLRRIANQKPSGPVVLLIHGAVENGKIFYTHSNKGLAPFLAEHGYCCYVADLRGRGESKPAICKQARYGQTEAIVEDIPAFIEKIEQLESKKPDFLVAHSWGGVLLNSVFARFPELINDIKACAYFGSKRSLFNNHPKKLFQANLIWYFMAPILAKKHGYLPAKRLKWGSDDETQKSHYQSMQWAKKNPWIDSDDGFDYAKTLANLTLPPTLHIAAVKDKALAQPIDIQKFIDESGTGVQKMQIYGRRFGHKVDYDHINMLTHPQARQEQFMDVLNWFEATRAN